MTRRQGQTAAVFTPCMLSVMRATKWRQWQNERWKKRATKMKQSIFRTICWEGKGEEEEISMLPLCHWSVSINIFLLLLKFSVCWCGGHWKQNSSIDCKRQQESINKSSSGGVYFPLLFLLLLLQRITWQMTKMCFVLVTPLSFKNDPQIW